ncbi:hypothetical protein BJ875DRAFT_129805 [Amylocarpus encephaloides]|uniref:Rhodopsin domain-containing protein n=1 Tax=Amylocarpus encephaloides TaxID=45428 RepID=A0A9P8C2J1_9HELO|nr:hypothetical protein BJ875DRAFT_129805 [Amylocarpus encephaloides]
MMNSTTTPEYLAADQSWRLLTVAVTFMVLETLFVLLYVASRLRSTARPGLDLYLMIAALAINIGLVVICFTSVRLGGLGHHIETITPAQSVSFTKSKIALLYMYIPSVVLPKLAILCLYLRLFKTPFYQHAAYAIGAILVVSMIVAWVLASVICVPFAYNWDESIEGGRCLNKGLLYALMSIPNIGTDVAIFVLPLPVVWKLKMGRAQKIGLTITFVTGSLGIITAIIRLIVFSTLSSDPDFSYSATDTVMWTVIEPGIYLIAACLPSLRPHSTRLSSLRQRFPLTATHSQTPTRSKSETQLVSSEMVVGKALVGCAVTLSSPWAMDEKWDEPRNSATCYRSRSVKSGDAGEAGEGRNPFVIRVQKTTSLVSELRNVRS